MQSKYFLFTGFLFIAIISNAQFKKGTRMVGATIGTAAFSSGSTDYSYPTAAGFVADNSNFNLSLSPSYGVFINKNTVVGISLLVNSSYQKINNKSLRDTIFSSSKASNTDFGVGGFFRYYFNTEKTLAPFLHFYLNGGTGFGNTSGFSFGSDGSGAYEESYTGKSSGKFFFNTGLNFGVTKMINPMVGLDAFAGYAFSYSKNKTEINSFRDYTSSADITQKFEPTQKFTGNGVNIGIGLQVFLQAKAKK